eukprot:SAG31_NODE_946_length_10832_cov_105.950806_10_plen_149_part_00
MLAQLRVLLLAPRRGPAPAPLISPVWGHLAPVPLVVAAPDSQVVVGPDSQGLLSPVCLWGRLASRRRDRTPTPPRSSSRAAHATRSPRRCLARRGDLADVLGAVLGVGRGRASSVCGGRAEQGASRAANASREEGTYATREVGSNRRC